MNSKTSMIDNLEAMLASGQDNSMLRFTLGSALWKEKNLDNAEVHLQSAVEQQSDYSAAWKILGRVLFDNEKYEEARDAYLAGLAAAKAKGDKQNEKEITVFLKRAQKRIDEESARIETADVNLADDLVDGRDDERANDDSSQSKQPHEG